MTDKPLPLQAYRANDRVEVRQNLASGLWARGTVLGTAVGEHAHELIVQSSENPDLQWPIRKPEDIRRVPTFTNVEDVEKYLNT